MTHQRHQSVPTYGCLSGVHPKPPSPAATAEVDAPQGAKNLLPAAATTSEALVKASERRCRCARCRTCAQWRGPRRPARHVFVAPFSLRAATCAAMNFYDRCLSRLQSVMGHLRAAKDKAICLAITRTDGLFASETFLR
ncbi:MAG: hypothetical protein R3C68_05015 [Myxococcota bacterium]